jgi:ribosomal protein L3
MSGLVAQKLSMTQIARGDALVAVTLLRVPHSSLLLRSKHLTKTATQLSFSMQKMQKAKQ